MHGWRSSPNPSWNDALVSAPARAPSRLAAHAWLAALSILLIPVHWLLGTGLVWGYALAFLFLLSALRFCAVEWCLSFFYAALALGMAVALLRGESADRIVGALYNLSVALVLLAFVNCGRRIQWSGRPELADGVYRAAYICFIIYIVYFACLQAVLLTMPPGQIVLPSLVFGLAGKLPGVLDEFSQVDIALTDWGQDGAAWRIIGFGMYATEGAILMAVIGILASMHAVRQGRYGRAGVIELATMIALVLMASRTTLGAYLLSLGLLGVLAGRRLLGPALLALPIGIAALVVGAIYGPAFLESTFSAVNEARAGSSGERFKAYGIAISMVLDTNIWTGLGVKPRDPALVSIPIGSHSTWVGAFTKGGIIALSLLALTYAAVAFKLLCGQAKIFMRRVDWPRAVELAFLSRAVLAMFFWWFTEDFDAPVQSAALAGLCVGLYLGALNPRPPRPALLWRDTSDTHSGWGQKLPERGWR